MEKTDIPNWPERAIEMLSYLCDLRDTLERDIKSLVKMLAEDDYANYEVLVSALKGE